MYPKPGFTDALDPLVLAYQILDTKLIVESKNHAATACCAFYRSEKFIRVKSEFDSLHHQAHGLLNILQALPARRWITRERASSLEGRLLARYDLVDAGFPSQHPLDGVYCQLCSTYQGLITS